MVNVIRRPERNPSFSQQIGIGLGELAGGGAAFAAKMGMHNASERKENEALKRFGIDAEGLSPDMKKEFVKHVLGTHGAKQAEKQQSIGLGLDTIQEMRQIVQGGNLGKGSWIKGFVDPQTREDRAKYEQLGRSLIPLVAAGVPIRNQREFDEYRKILTDPGAFDAEIIGALEGLEGLLKRAYQTSEEQPSHESSMSMGKSERPVFDISNPGHKEARDKILKKYKGNREQASKKLAEMFE